jgi:type II secretory pathway pseudopilin PulG
MAALLVAIAVMGILMSVAMPTWRHAAQREKEEELVFRGRQYMRAIQLYQRRFAASFPADMDVLVKQKFLRKKYADPMSEDGAFEVIYQGTALSVGGARGATPQGPTGAQGRGGTQPSQSFTFDSRSGAITQGSPGARAAGPRGGIIGVRSRSTEESIRVYNGATHYNEWQFVFVPTMIGQPGMRGGQGRPGMPGQRGMPGGRGGGFGSGRSGGDRPGGRGPGG